MDMERCESEICTPPEIREQANNLVIQNLLPEKSKNYYIKIYSEFKDWCHAKM